MNGRVRAEPVSGSLGSATRFPGLRGVEHQARPGEGEGGAVLKCLPATGDLIQPADGTVRRVALRARLDLEEFRHHMVREVMEHEVEVTGCAPGSQGWSMPALTHSGLSQRG